MNSRQEFMLKKTSIVIFGMFGFITIFLAALYLMLSESRHSEEFLFGLARRGFVELAVFFLLSILFLVLSVVSLKSWHRFASKAQRFISEHRVVLWVVFGAGLILGWAAVTIPPEFFGRFSGYYQWLRPILMAFGLTALLGFFLYLIGSGYQDTLLGSTRTETLRVFIFAFVLALVVFGFSYITKFGVISDTPLWNVPGVPVSGTQMFFGVMTFTCLVILELSVPPFRRFLSRRGTQAAILVLVFLGALLIWGFTPLQGDSLSVAPSLSTSNPFPRRDARVHDLGALSILYGEGINFKSYTDKPLYMVLLAVSHLAAGYDYNALGWIQVGFLSLIPILVYLLGKKTHSSMFGLFASALVILQQRNAIVLSRMISSSNVKILATETIILLGILAVTLLLFSWNRNNDKWTMLIVGGFIGALSLIRLNPLLFLPAVALLIVFYYIKTPRLMLTRGLLLLAGFLIIFSPWVITGRNPGGISFIYQKIIDVLQTRVAPIVQVTPSDIQSVQQAGGVFYETPLTDTPVSLASMQLDVSTAGNLELAPKESGLGDESGSLLQYLRLLSEHYMHNLFASVIPLPDILTRTGIRTLAQRDYWSDSQIWDGQLSSGLIRFQIINLAFISFGVTTSWRRHRWRGLLPLFMFLVYNLAVSISLTSGGRYIVPIHWVVFFYYALAYAGILDILAGFLKPGIPWSDAEDSVIPTVSSARKPLLISFIVIVIVATLIPAANLLVPRLVPKNPAEKSQELFAVLGPQQLPGRQYQAGIVMYPEYHPGGGWLVFDFYNGEKVEEFSVPMFSAENSTIIMNTTLQHGDAVLLVFDTEQQLTEIYIFRENQPVRYWSRHNRVT